MITICDTKFEFGLDENGTPTLMDEVLTPDSSRFGQLILIKKEQIRPHLISNLYGDWLEQSGWNKQPPAPKVPKEGLKNSG